MITTFPNYPIRVNGNHPIGKHLIWAWTGSDPSAQNLAPPYNAQGGIAGDGETISRGDSIYIPEATKINTESPQPDIPVDGNYIWGVRFKLVSNVGTKHVVFGNRQGSTFPGNNFIKFGEGGMDYFASGARDFSWTYGSDVGVIYDLMLTRNGTEITGYLNGVADKTDTATAVMVSNPVLLGGGRPDTNSTEQTDVEIYHAFHGPASASADQVREIYDDPYSLFEPAGNNVYFFPGETPEPSPVPVFMNQYRRRR